MVPPALLRTSVNTLVGAGKRRSSCPNILLERSLHTSVLQRRNSYDLAGRVSEVFSSSTKQPSSINELIDMIHVQSPQNCASSFHLKWKKFTTKGLKVGRSEAGARPIVIISGNQARERVPIGVSLYVAAGLSERALGDVNVTVFPVMQPQDYEMYWNSEQLMKVAPKLAPITNSPPPSMPLFEHERGIEVPLRAYMRKRCTNFIHMELNLDKEGGCTSRVLYNSLDAPMKRADGFMRSMPKDAGAKFATGETSLFERIAGPPGLIIELRDKERRLSEEDISKCGEEVMKVVQKVVEDTTSPRGFVL